MKIVLLVLSCLIASTVLTSNHLYSDHTVHAQTPESRRISAPGPQYPASAAQDSTLALPDQIATIDIINAAGREWAQVDLFYGLSWEDIEAACPASSGRCIQGTQLNGFDMSGWTWASLGDIHQLFNSYLPSGDFGATASTHISSSRASNWKLHFLNNGWRTMDKLGYSHPDLVGWLRNPYRDDPDWWAHMAEVRIREDSSCRPGERVEVCSYMSTSEVWTKQVGFQARGAWFHRPAASLASP